MLTSWYAIRRALCAAITLQQPPQPGRPRGNAAATLCSVTACLLACCVVWPSVRHVESTAKTTAGKLLHTALLHSLG
eukprot:6198046-Pleurochrysis_carterae.AAC.5